MLTKAPGYDVYEYKLVLPLPEALENKIWQVRKEFGETYRYKPDPSRPHVTVARFTQWQLMEERICQKLRLIGMSAAPFKLEMKDYAAYPSHTIFIKVSTSEPMRLLLRSVKELQRLLKHDGEHKPFFPSDAAICIGRKLAPWQFEQGWKSYAHRQFTGRCIADSMLLLKRQQPGDAWQIVSRFDLENMPVRTMQTSMF